MRDLIDWVGRDAVRFFLVSRKADSEFVFDVDLRARRARRTRCTTCSTRTRGSAACLRNGRAITASSRRDAGPARQRRKELQLAQRLAEFPDMVAAARARSSRRIRSPSTCASSRANSTATIMPSSILVEDEALRAARLALCAAVRQTLANGLALLGVSAPEKM